MSTIDKITTVSIALSTVVQKGSEKMKFTVVASAPVVIKTFEGFDTNV